MRRATTVIAVSERTKRDVVEHLGIPEVVGDAALSVDPGDVESLADALKAAVEPATAGELSRRGVRRARTFDWDRTAAETLRVYRRVGADAAAVAA